ncbi:Uncharacterised protein [Streptococcus pneumoniae]|nr:Uncharacterised protein [Streptococcus pneumoniae]CVX95503.1 Uncharacterised protein [Streptococcus pneumoniae]VNL45617.1 Uncharacterised protein [Streptococcus pneumoniae]VOC74948.1 Uncharacterised protein [Streptococcus pneumoniae]VOP15558.1 Uncharacterised protein [Streptococcus pneumoniae]
MVTMRDSYTSGGSTCDLRWVENKAIRFHMALTQRQFVELFQETINVITLTCLTVSVAVVACVSICSSWIAYRRYPVCSWSVIAILSAIGS